MVTRLSIIAIPGRPYSFSPKLEAGLHVGTFTRLTVTAIPGRRLTFIAKESEVIVVPPVPPEPPGPPDVSFGAMGGGGPLAEQRVRDHKRILREDKDLTEFIAIILTSGILDI